MSRHSELRAFFSDPVTTVLLFAKGAMGSPTRDRPTHTAEGKQISYHYTNPLEEMLFNKRSRIKYVLAEIATPVDATILRDRRLVHNQIRIFPYATVWRARKLSLMARHELGQFRTVEYESST